MAEGEKLYRDCTLKRVYSENQKTVESEDDILRTVPPDYKANS